MCLNVLHHLRNPLSALDKLIAATRDSLVLEIASLGAWDSQKFGAASGLAARWISRLPVFYLADALQSFFMSESAVVTLLKKHRQDFARVDITKGGHKGRFIAIARKRRIGHLYIVAGVNAVGKTTFLDSLSRGENLDIAREVGLDLVIPWSRVSYSDLAKDGEPAIPNMILQYNISKHLIDGDLHQHERGILDLVRCAEKVTVLTLWHSGEKIAQRYRDQRLESAERSKRKRGKKKAKRLMDLYRNPAQFEAIYADWFSFLKRHGLRNNVLLQEPYRLISAADWNSPQPQ
jgi:hypothetical protein